MHNQVFARPNQAGVSLIEVLIALLVLSLGILGVMRLQTVGLKMTQSASNRMMATLLAGEILERMRLNRVEAISGAYALSFGGAVTAGGQQWRKDLSDWTSQLSSQLPLGQGEIIMLGTQATVTVRWDEAWDEDSADGKGRVFLMGQL